MAHWECACLVQDRVIRSEVLTTLLKNCQRVKVALSLRWAEELDLPWANAARKAVEKRLGHSRWTARLKDGTTLVLNP